MEICEKANENEKIKPSHLRYAIDDFQAYGAGDGHSGLEGSCAGGVAAGRRLRQGSLRTATGRARGR